MKLVSALQISECNIFDGCGAGAKCAPIDGEFKCLSSCVASQPTNSTELEAARLSSACLCSGKPCRAGDKCIDDSFLSLIGISKRGTYCVVDCPSGDYINFGSSCLCKRGLQLAAYYSAICYNSQSCQIKENQPVCVNACATFQMNYGSAVGACGCGQKLCNLDSSVCYSQFSGSNGMAPGAQCLPACLPGQRVVQTCYCSGLCNNDNFCSTSFKCECRPGGFGPCSSSAGTCPINAMFSGVKCTTSAGECRSSELNTPNGNTVCDCGGSQCLVYQSQVCLSNRYTTAVEGCYPVCGVGVVSGKCGCSNGTYTSYAAPGQKCHANGLVSCTENVILKYPCMCGESYCNIGKACYSRPGYDAVCVSHCDGGLESKAGCICQENDPENVKSKLFCANNIRLNGKRNFCVNRLSDSAMELPGSYLVCLNECNAGYVGTSVPCKCVNLPSEAEQCPADKYCAGGKIGSEDSTICGVPCGDDYVIVSSYECVCRSDYSQYESVCRKGYWCTGMVIGNIDNNKYRYMPNNKGNSKCVSKECSQGVVPKQDGFCRIYGEASEFACSYKSYANNPMRRNRECIKICDHEQSGVDDSFGYGTGKAKCVCNSDPSSPLFFCYPYTGANRDIYCVSMEINTALSDLPVPSAAALCVPGCPQGILALTDKCKCALDQTVGPCTQNADLLYYCAGGTAITSSTARCVIPCTDGKAGSDGCVCSTDYDRQSSVCGANDQREKPYCTGMRVESGQLRPNSSGQCVVLCQLGENTLGYKCRCWGSAQLGPCNKGEYCIYGAPGSATADLFRFRCTDGVATEAGDVGQDGNLKGCVCNNADYRNLATSVCRAETYCVGMASNKPATTSLCVERCRSRGKNEAAASCKCELSRNRPGCPSGHYCVGDIIATNTVCVPKCTEAAAKASTNGLTDGCLCNDDFASKSSICAVGQYCIRMGGSASDPLPSSEAKCTGLCSAGIVSNACKCLLSPQAEPCEAGFYCTDPGKASAKCIPPCTNAAAGELGCLCSTERLVCAPGKYCVQMAAGPMISAAAVCVDMCQQVGMVEYQCKCGGAASYQACAPGKYCVGYLYTDAECYDGCGSNAAGSHSGGRCACYNDHQSVASLCSEYNFCVQMGKQNGLFVPSASAMCVSACSPGYNSTGYPCKCSQPADSSICVYTHYCVAGTPALDASAVCLPNECAGGPAGDSGCVCSTTYHWSNAACFGDRYCVGLAKDHSQQPDSSCVENCMPGLVLAACRCALDIRTPACKPGSYCAGGSIPTSSQCVFSCPKNAKTNELCACSKAFESVTALCYPGQFCLNDYYMPTSAIPSANNTCIHECVFNEPSGTGCYCFNSGLCKADNYCAYLPDLTYQCLPLCYPQQESGEGCFCKNHGYCRGAQICEANGCQIYECKADSDCVTENYFCHDSKCTHCSYMFASCALCDSNGCWGVNDGNNNIRAPIEADCKAPQYYYDDNPAARCVRCPDNHHTVGRECKLSLCTIYSDCFSDEYFCNNLICTPCSAFPVENCTKCDNFGCFQITDSGAARYVSQDDCSAPFYFNFGDPPSCRKCTTSQFVHRNTCVSTACGTDADCRFEDLYCASGTCRACSALMAGCSHCDVRGCYRVAGQTVQQYTDCKAPLVFAGDSCRVCYQSERYDQGKCYKLFPVAYVAGGIGAALAVVAVLVVVILCMRKRKISAKAEQKQPPSKPSESAVPGDYNSAYSGSLNAGPSFAKSSISLVNLAMYDADIPQSYLSRGLTRAETFYYENGLRSVSSVKNLPTLETEIDGEDMMIFRVHRNGMRKYQSQTHLQRYNPQ